MNSLPRNETFRVESAEGWLMLGNPLEANEELEQIPAEYRYHPSVLAMRWQVYAVAEWWEAAWIVSKALCEMMPESPEVWICQANTLRKYKGLIEAHDVLKHVVDQFPEEPVVR